MNRPLLIRKIAEEFSVSEETASDYIKNIFGTIIRTLSSGKSVNIAEFGKFIIKNNKIYFSPVKRFAREINFNYAGLETIKIRNYNEKEFREKFDRLKRIEEEIELQLGGVSPDAAEAYIRLPKPPLSKKQEIKTEKPEISDDKFINDNISDEKKEKIPEENIFNNVISETEFSTNEEITTEEAAEEDIEETVKSAIDEFMRSNFPEEDETSEEEQGKITGTLPGFLDESRIKSEDAIKDRKEFKPFIQSGEKAAPEDFSDYIIHKEHSVKEEDEIKDTKQVIREPESPHKDITKKPVEKLKDLEKFIIKPGAEAKEEIKKPEEDTGKIDRIIEEPTASKKDIKDIPAKGLEDIDKFIIEHPDKSTEEIIPKAPKTEKPEEIPEAMKNIEDDLSKKIDEAKTYKDKVFKKNKLDDLISEREKIISEIKLSTDYTIEPFRPEEPEEPIREIEKEEKKTENFKDFIIPETGTEHKEPDKSSDLKDKKTEPEPDINKMIEEREKIIREIEKTSGFNAETFMTKKPEKSPQENIPEEKKTEGFDSFRIPASKSEPQESQKNTDVPGITDKREFNRDEITDEQKRISGQEFKNPEMTVFDKLIKDTKKEDDIDEHIAGLDKIKDNLKSERLDIKDYIIPHSEIPTRELHPPEREIISGELKELHDEIIKPVEKPIPDKLENFNDVFIEDKKVIFYNTKETLKADELNKKANFKNYEDVFFRFEDGKKKDKPGPKKEKSLFTIGLIWFVIIAVILTILVLIIKKVS